MEQQVRGGGDQGEEEPRGTQLGPEVNPADLDLNTLMSLIPKYLAQVTVLDEEEKALAKEEKEIELSLVSCRRALSERQKRAAAAAAAAAKMEEGLAADKQNLKELEKSLVRQAEALAEARINLEAARIQREAKEEALEETKKELSDITSAHEKVDTTNGQLSQLKAAIEDAEAALAAAEAEAGGNPEQLDRQIEDMMEKIDNAERENNLLMAREKELEEGNKTRAMRIKKLEQEIRTKENRHAAQKLRLQKAIANKKNIGKADQKTS